LLGYLRCGLQYRYSRLGALPPSRPVQLWFGQFIHGVLEEAFRRYDESRRGGAPRLPPLPDDELQDILALIQRRLAARGLIPWSDDVEELGRARARAAVNELGPELFPLIHQAEVRLTGARMLRLDQIPAEFRFREADRYEMVGIVDVITHVQMEDPALRGNRFLAAILRNLPGNPPPAFEIIVDYKGMRRPPYRAAGGAGPDLWSAYGWQVHTYAHLRSLQRDSLPVMAGVIVYVNELVPTPTDLQALRRETKEGSTDVPLDAASERVLDGWNGRQPVPALPYEFRLARALRVLPISEASMTEALRQFDEIVAKIETCRGKELANGRIISSWEQNVEASTCTACDARTFCPSYADETEPALPGMHA
jgi:hypothetical protein